MPAPTSPARSISRVISANSRSESVSPLTSAIASPRWASSAGRPSSTPLCANSLPCCSKGCVLRSSSAPVEAKRTCATNVLEHTSLASRAKAASS